MIGSIITWILAIGAIAISVVSLIKNFSREGPSGKDGERGPPGPVADESRLTRMESNIAQNEEDIKKNEQDITTESTRAKTAESAIEDDINDIKNDYVKYDNLLKIQINPDKECSADGGGPLLTGCRYDDGTVRMGTSSEGRNAEWKIIKS